MYTRSIYNDHLAALEKNVQVFDLSMSCFTQGPGYRDQKSVSARSSAIIAPAEEATKRRSPAITKF